MHRNQSRTRGARSRETLVAVLVGGFLLLCAACGETPRSTDAPYREPVDPVKDAKVAERTLAPRDTPLEIGATAPPLPGVEATEKRVVVFYRGHW